MTGIKGPCGHSRITEPQRRLLVALCTGGRSEDAPQAPRPGGAQRPFAALLKKGLVRPAEGSSAANEVEPTEAAYALLGLDRRSPALRNDRTERIRARVAPGTGRSTSEVVAPKQTKAESLLVLLRQPKGASLTELQAAVGWQPHSVRGFLSGTVRKRLGLKLTAAIGDDGMRGATGLRSRPTMASDPGTTADDLQHLSRAELVARWVAIYRHPPPKGVKRGLLERAIGWHARAKREGGLSPALARQLSSHLSRRADVASPRRPSAEAGGRLVREWGGRTHVVNITDEGFAWNGRTYRSLSSVARAITGARWSGPRFFGVNADGQ